MPIVLQRVDERLIHGQVVIGWGDALRPQRFVVVDDELAASDWEQELYALGAGDAETLFVTVDEARAALDRWRSDPARTVLLTRDIATMRRLADGGLLQGTHVNLGGIHHGPDRTEVLTYLHLTDQDFEDLRDLAAVGVEVVARDLPDTHSVALPAILEGH